MDMEKSSSAILTGFAYYLVQKSLLDEAKAHQALHQSTPFISYLSQQNWIPSVKLSTAVSEYFSLSLLDLDAFNTNLFPKELLTAPFVQQHLALPLMKTSDTLYLAVPDPTIPMINEIKFVTGLKIRLIIVAADRLQVAIANSLNQSLLLGLGNLDDEKLNELNFNAYTEEKENIEELDNAIDSSPIVLYVNKILLEGINKNASDIHFEPYENSYRIRFRLDGILHKIATPPSRLANYLVARIKVMANLNTAERRIPQDGRFKLILSKTRTIDFRISTCPTLYGEKVVMRLLAPAQALPKIEMLGMLPQQQKHFSEAFERSQGMILVSGPTGSGKTVTLYTALNILNTLDVNILTVEDPIEIPVMGINQVNVNQKTGLTFSAALRSFLRQDPDIIMVGEIRDLETAEIAVKAAQTGHLVLSTIHTNSAVETITRLGSMGVASYNVASSLLLIISQRLVRRLCDHCKEKISVSKEILIEEGFQPTEVDNLQLYTAKGCEHCYNGYKGRLGIFEVLPITSTMEELILANATAPQLALQASKEGILTLRNSGLNKIREGLTSLAELNRVFKG